MPKAHIKPFQLHEDYYQCLQIQLKQCLARALMINSSRKHIHTATSVSTHTHTLSEQLLLPWMLKGSTAGQAWLCVDIKGTAIERITPI